MPIYEYRCIECDDVTEVLQRFSDRPKRKCTRCSGRLEKLVSRTSFHLKGGGWYSEGYNRGSKGTDSAGKSSSPSGDASDEKKKSKPKSETKKKASSG